MNAHMARAMKDPELLIACKTALSTYVTTVVIPESVFINPSSVTGTGIDVYIKRQEFARKVLEDANPYLETMAGQVGLIEPDYWNAIVGSGQQLFAYLIGNGAPGQILEAQPQHATWNFPGNTSGLTLFDMLAGVDGSDRIA